MTRSPTALAWPELPLNAWRGTRDTLHMCTQIIGKSLLASAPPQNHWWHTALRVTSRGLYGSSGSEDRCFDVDVDLIGHVVALRTEFGAAMVPLRPRSVRSFYEQYIETLRGLGIDLRIWTTPVEVRDPIPFERDEVHVEYDAGWASRFRQVLHHVDASLKEVAASYVGKQSPVHFFWGSFDLASTRFSGRRAPERTGADPVTREAYSHEVISFGFWPGGISPAGVSVDEPVLYGYAAPEPAGFREAALGVDAASYDPRLGEFILPYEAVRTAPDPVATVRAFCDAVYQAGASSGAWDRAAIERLTGDPAAR